MKALVLVAVPAGVVTVMGPVLAPAGTLAVMLVALPETMAASVPLKATRAAPDRFCPVMVTWSPAAPEAGMRQVMAGVTAVVIRPIPLLLAWANHMAPSDPAAMWYGSKPAPG